MSNLQSKIRNQQSSFSIVTPSYNQLDWLRLCVASVRDQVAAPVGMLNEELSIADSNSESKIKNSALPPPCLTVEHIIQDAGSPGIEEFAREMGADFYRDGELVFASSGNKRSKLEDRGQRSVVGGQGSESPSPISHLPSPIPYRLTIYCERDRGMYDAINRGLSKTSGEICAWLNCDEQYLPESLAKVAGFFQQAPSMDILLGDALLTDSSHRPVCYRRIMVPNRWHTRLDHLHSLSCAMFFKRSALPNPPLDPRWRVISDAVLMDYFLQTGKRIVACKELLSAYAFTGVNLSADKTNTEHGLWWQETQWPPKWTRPAVVVHNRIRRMLHGSYRKFPIQTALHTMSSPDARVPLHGIVPGTWPKS